MPEPWASLLLIFLLPVGICAAFLAVALFVAWAMLVVKGFLCAVEWAFERLGVPD